jgi:hypothetical protein
MTTITEARGVIRTRLTNAAITHAGSPVPLYWQNETAALPDTPSPFAYVEFLNEGSTIVAYGAGRGGNTHRNRARVEAHVFVPKGWGLDAAEAIAEQIAAALRSHRDQHVSCFDATVMPGGDGAGLTPPGLSSPVGSYFWAAVEVSLTFDQVG